MIMLFKMALVKGYSERAVAYKAMGEKAKAEADFEKAKELRGEN